MEKLRDFLKGWISKDPTQSKKSRSTQEKDSTNYADDGRE